MKPVIASGIVALAMMVLFADVVSGQNYPNKSLRIVTAGLGGGSDFAARVIAQGITGPLGQPVIVDNRSSNIVGDIVAAAPPDGYTLLVIGSSFWIAPFLQKTSYDPVRDFSPITLAERSPNVLVVHPSVPAKSVKELIAFAKAKPGALNYGSSAPGSSSQLAGELFKAMAGVNIVNVPYKAMGLALNDLLGGQVQLIFGASAVAPHIKTGKLRALAVTTAAPSSLFPDLPTVAATIPGYEAVSVTGVLAPSKTPATVVNRLNQEIVRSLNTEDTKQKFFNLGAESVGTTPAQLAAAIKSEMASMGKIIKDTGIGIEGG